MSVTLWIGERNYSSWSLRAWAALEWSQLPYEERFVSLDQDGYGAEGIAAIRALSPSGRIPVLQVDGHAIWDSLAICEWLAERTPLWPADPWARAEARAVSCEMHAGFVALRRDLPMNIRRRCRPPAFGADVQRDLARVEALWAGLRQRYATSGPWLFGARSIADSFYLPVATRLRSYGVVLGGLAQQYAQTLLADAAFLRWERAALVEWQGPFPRAAIDSLYPGTDVAEHGA